MIALPLTLHLESGKNCRRYPFWRLICRIWGDSSTAGRSRAKRLEMMLDGQGMLLGDGVSRSHFSLNRTTEDILSGGNSAQRGIIVLRLYPFSRAETSPRQDISGDNECDGGDAGEKCDEAPGQTGDGSHVQRQNVGANGAADVIFGIFFPREFLAGGAVQIEPRTSVRVGRIFP